VVKGERFRLPGWATVIVSRFLLAIPILLAVSVGTFGILFFTQGDRVTALLGERANDPEQVERLREQLGLNRPFIVQYFDYLRMVVVERDFGRSWFRAESVSEALVTRLPATIELTIAAMCIAILIGLTSGLLAAWRKHTMIDYAATSVALLGVSIPVFWLGLMLVYVGAVHLRWFPTSGRLPVGLPDFPHPTGLHVIDGMLAGRWDVVRGAIRHLAMPAFTVGLISSALIARMTRTCMIESGQQDFIRTARAKGLTTMRVQWHALRHAMIPIVTVIGLEFGTLLGGAIVTETIFTWEGVGKYLVESILVRDSNAVQGAILTIVFAYIVVNLVVDVLYTLLDPRIRS